MKKQGFTLIELMVVIVIMGILAAVAVPKLFGMIAKSKASEVGPAAGEYVKLQDAYVSETGLYIGKWNAIGYTMSNSTASFDYSDKVSGTSLSKSIPSSAEAAWEAKAKVGLNDCTANSTWTLWLAKDGSKNGLVWGAGINKNAAGAGPKDASVECTVLTPQFGNLSTGL